MKGRHLKIIQVLGVAAITASVSPVQAGTLSVAPSLAECDGLNASQAERYAPGTLIEVGGGIPLSYTGFGTAVPLGSALRLVLPPGYDIYGLGADGAIQTRSVMTRPVTWKSDDQPWPAVARGLLRQAGAMGVLQWESKRLLVSDGVTLPVPEGYATYTPASLPALSMMSTMSATPGAAPQGGATSSSVLPLAPQVPATPEWVLERDQSLSEGVRQWAEREGWVVLWESGLQTRVPNRAVFRGSLREAITDVVLAVNRDLRPADVPLAATFYPENRTLVIRDFRDLRGGE